MEIETLCILKIMLGGKAILIILLVLIGTSCFGQAKKIDSCYFIRDTLTGKQIYKLVDKPATVAGNKDSVYVKILKHIKASYRDKAPGETWVAVAFVIDEKGKVSGKRIVRGKVLGQQLLDVIEKFEWRPAICGGVPVASLYFLPVAIHISE